MSSHHFVTESQSDGLLVASDRFHPEVFRELLGWNPVVIVCEAAVERVMSSGIRIDVWVTGPEVVREFPYTVERWSPTALDRHLKEALKEGRFAGVIQVGAWTGTTVREAEQLLKSPPAVRALYGRFHRYLRLDTNRIYRRWMPAGHAFQIFPPNVVEAEGVTCRGPGSFEMPVDGLMTLHPLQDIIMIESL